VSSTIGGLHNNCQYFSAIGLIFHEVLGTVKYKLLIATTVFNCFHLPFCHTTKRECPTTFPFCFIDPHYGIHRNLISVHV